MTKRTSEIDVGIDLNKVIEKVDFDALDPNLRTLIRFLLNKVEELEKNNKELRLEKQQLRDENNRLKGEQGKPDIRPQTPSKDISSEAERKTLKSDKTKKSKAKNYKIKIDRIEKCKVDKSTLPPDAVFKGCRSVIVQDLIIHTDNVQFEKEVYYPSSLKHTVMGEVPKGYEGEFGPGVKAFVLSAHYQSNMTESAIVATLETHGDMHANDIRL